MAKKFKDTLETPKEYTAKIKNKTVPVVAFKELKPGQKHVINIDQNDINFDLQKDKNPVDTVPVVAQGNEIVLPAETITIGTDTYTVLSGRLIDENPEIDPFYQLEVKKI